MVYSNFINSLLRQEHPNKKIAPFIDAIYLVDTVFVEIRKGVPLTRYVINIKDEDVWCPDSNDMIRPPKDILGLWIQEQPDDNSYYNFREIIDNNDFSLIRTFVKTKIKYQLKKTYEI